MNYSKISFILKLSPPYFVGSQLRGALGYALKKVTCINPNYQCSECFAKDSCLYYEFYESKSYHKFRFDFELGKKYYDFNFYLFDESATKLPYVISAFDKVFSEFGLGKIKILRLI
jgi:hypothetical protein